MAAADKKVEKDEEEQEQAPEPKKSSALKWIIIGVIVVLVLGGGGAGAYFFLSKSHNAEKKPVEQAKAAVAVFYPMEPFIVNLVDNEGERYLKIVLQMELSDSLLAGELDILKPKLRDSILELLASKSSKDMLDANGKQRLRDEVVMRANSFATKGKVLKVYFTELVIQ
jgi:flagellar FliL protein